MFCVEETGVGKDASRNVRRHRSIQARGDRDLDEDVAVEAEEGGQGKFGE